MAVPLWHDLPFGNLSWLAYVWHIVRWRKARAKLMLSGKNCPDKHPETHVTQHHQATISADARKNPLKQTSPGSLLLRLEPWAMESVGSLKWPRRLAEVVRRGRAANLRNCWRDQLTFKRCCGEGSWRGGCRGRCFFLGRHGYFFGLGRLGTLTWGFLVARAGIKPATIKFTDARQHGQDPVVFDGPNVIKCVYQELCVFILFIFPLSHRSHSWDVSWCVSRQADVDGHLVIFLYLLDGSD